MNNPDNPSNASSPTKPSNPFDVPANEPVNAQERIERFIDARLNQLLEKQCKKVNEGNNGAILQLHVNDIPEDLLETLQESGISIETDQAVKVLKFYATGSGKREFEMQRKAYQIISNYKGDKPMANVPKIHLYRDLPILPSVREKLKNIGVEKIGQKVELLVMDFVPGQDLATIMFREIIRNSPHTRDLINVVDSLGMNDLEEALDRVLQLPIAGNTYRDEVAAQNQEARQKILRYNKIKAELNKRGFRIHPVVLEQVRNTMQLLHENGLCHRDGHHRNFMISGDYSPEAPKPPQTYVIDFGSAISFEGDYGEIRDKLYREGWGSGDPKRQTDEDIIELLEHLVKGGESIQSKALKIFEKRFQNSRAELLAEREGRKFVQLLRNQLENGDIELVSHYDNCPTRPKRPFAFMSALLELKNEGLISESQLINAISAASKIAAAGDRNELLRALVVLQGK